MIPLESRLEMRSMGHGTMEHGQWIMYILCNGEWTMGVEGNQKPELQGN